MSLLKIMNCNNCNVKIVYPQKTRWNRILKTAKAYGWTVKKHYQLCPECSFDMGIGKEE